ncbi:GNAT family N-acetyltransferase [Bacillus sp. BGMRC 2118]|nr:GNAT family N-acetyltransferase [Bacillus sp. BGMRC 2118]
MILKKSHLTSVEINKLTNLIKVCEEQEEIQLAVTINLSTSQNRNNEGCYDYFYCVDEELVGYLGAFAIPGVKQMEITGMVHPSFRRKGIFSSLLKEAISDLQLFKEQLLIIDYHSTSGKQFIDQCGASLSHSEFLLQYGKPVMATSPSIEMLEVREEDLSEVITIHSKAFGVSENEARGVIEQNFSSNMYNMLLAKDKGCTVGSLSILNRESYYISAFSVDPLFQGKGIGKQMLLQTVQSLGGNQSIMIEVEVNNDHALKLYQACGFVIKAGFNYYKLNTSFEKE